MSTERTPLVNKHHTEVVSILVIIRVIIMGSATRTVVLTQRFRWKDLRVELDDLENGFDEGFD